jgi:hypothetical protein
MAQAKTSSVNPPSVGVMLFVAEIGLMIKQPINAMGGVPHRGTDEFAVEWGVLVRHVSVEGRQRRERDSRTRIRHSCQPKSDAIGKDGGEQQRTIRHCVAGTQVCEVPPKVVQVDCP